MNSATENQWGFGYVSKYMSSYLSDTVSVVGESAAYMHLKQCETRLIPNIIELYIESKHAGKLILSRWLTILRGTTYALSYKTEGLTSFTLRDKRGIGLPINITIGKDKQQTTNIDGLKVKKIQPLIVEYKSKLEGLKSDIDMMRSWNLSNESNIRFLMNDHRATEHILKILVTCCYDTAF